MACVSWLALEDAGLAEGEWASELRHVAPATECLGLHVDAVLKTCFLWTVENP